MHPLYWTASKKGIFMRYGYEFKRKCVDMYRRQGKYLQTPKGVKADTFHHQVKDWAELKAYHDPEILKHKPANKEWTADKKFERISKVLAGESPCSVAIQAEINRDLLYS